MRWPRVVAAALCGLAFLTLQPSAPDLAPRSAEASVAMAVTLDELVRHADVALVGQSVESHSQWESVAGGRRIVTYTRLQLLEQVYGQPPSELWVRTLGGVVGRIGQQVAGEARLVVGARHLLFLTRTPDGALVVTARAQGHFLVVDDGGTPKLRPSPDVGTVVRRSRQAPTASAELGDQPLRAGVELVIARRGRVHADR